MRRPCCTEECHDGPGCYWLTPGAGKTPIVCDTDPRSSAEREAHRITAHCWDRDAWGVNEDGWW